MSELAKKRAVDEACHAAQAVFAAQCDKMLAYYGQEVLRATTKGDTTRARELAERAAAFEAARKGYETEAKRAQAHFSQLDKELEETLKEMEESGKCAWFTC